MPAIELPALYVDNVAALVATSRPVLVNRDPGPDESEVPIGWPVILDLVDPGPEGIDQAATRIWIDGVLAFDGNAATALRPGFDGPRAQVMATADTLRIVLDPALPFASEARVQVHVTSAIMGGAHTLDQAYSFTIEDRTAPKVVGAQATAPRVVQLGFDEEATVVDAAGIRFASLDRPAVPVTVVAAEARGTVVAVTLDTEMTPDARYQVSVTGIADVHGNPVLPPHDTAVLVGFRPRSPPGRRFELWSMLPAHNRRMDATGDLRRFIACLQEVTDLLLAEVDRFPDIFDLERAPVPFVELILCDLGTPFPFELDELGKRRLASVLVEMYRQKGTAVGIRNAIRFFLGIEVTAIVPFAGTALVLGESALGEDWELGPSDRFARYAFHVQVGVPLTEQQRRQIRAIVRYLKPAHTHFIDLIEPAPPPTFDHWELGISELGASTDLH